MTETAFDRRLYERDRRREFRLIMAVSYPLFLAAAVAGRLRRSAPRDDVRRSVFAEARAAADRTLPYAF